MANEMSFLAAALVVVCVVSSARGMLATVTTIPLAGQALQVLGLVYASQLAWKRWGPNLRDNLANVVSRVPLAFVTKEPR